MANELTADGLTVDSATEIVTSLTVDMQSIYGADINVDSNSPDGQMINIFAQVAADILELLVDVYNSFTVQSSYGVMLDQRVAINGITRRAGTYTITNVTVTVTQALTLTGLDELVNDPTALVFTVQDASGNQFYLEETHVFAIAGSASLSFRAKEVGQVLVTPNTITNQTTTILGVSSVNNPAVPTEVGVNEETDAQLKVRHGQSFALAATGPADTVEAQLQATEGILDAYVLENVENVETDGIPAHSIWCIVNGGAAADIAQVIYSKKSSGCGMLGDESYTITRPNGNGFVALWDEAVSQPLYIQFNIQGRVAGTAFDTVYLADQLALALNPYRLGQNPTIGDVIAAMLTISPDAFLTLVGVSTDGIVFEEVVEPDDAINYFTLDAANIDITT